MFILGILVFLLIIVATMFISANTIGYFLDIPSILFVLGLYFASLLATSGVNDFLYGLKCIAKKEFIGEDVQIKKSLEAFYLLNKVTLGICLLGFITGLISLLSQIKDMSTFGPSIAVALLVSFYALVINTCFIKTSISILKKKLL